jgi:hypothetical protein
MSQSPILEVWPESIAAARIPANNNVRLLQALLLNPAISATTAAQPGSPAEGDVYILPASPTGSNWAAFFEDDVVIYYNATWTAYTPLEGLRKFVEDEGEDWQFVGSSSGGWAPVGGGGGSAAWGSITGTLSDQTDLDAALDAKAALASPTFTGTPSGPTASPLTSNTQLATTEYVDDAVAAGGGGGAVSSVNGQTGAVVLALDDLDDVDTTGVADTYVLTFDFASGNWIAAPGGGGGGLTGYTATLETASPNNTNNVSRLKASGGTTNQHAVLEAKGFGGVAAQSADGTAARGDPRGFNTVDWQSTRANANEVASADNSGVLWGNSCKASGQYAAAGGNSAYAEGANSIAFGDNITADGAYSIGFGKSVKVKGVYGGLVRANGTHPGGLDGECQSRGIMLYCGTSNATPTRLTANGGAAASTNQIRLNLNFQWYLVKGTVIAVEKTSGDYAMWEFTALITRNFGTSMLVACTPVLLGSAGSGSTWALAVTADASLNTLAIDGTGGASSTIRWQCDIYSSNELGWT